MAEQDLTELGLGLSLLHGRVLHLR